MAACVPAVLGIQLGRTPGTVEKKVDRLSSPTAAGSTTTVSLSEDLLSYEQALKVLAGAVELFRQRPFSGTARNENQEVYKIPTCFILTNSQACVNFMKVLFVCSGNAFRSPVAEALLKKRKPQIEVDSAGANPTVPEAIAGSAWNYSAREGAEKYLKHCPERLEDKQLHDYDLIVAMEPRHKDAILRKSPGCEKKTVVWNIEDPYLLPHGHTMRIFKQIRDKVEDLADSL